MNYVSAKIAKEYLKVSPNTLKVWKDNGIIKTKILSKKKILYDIDSVLNVENNEDGRKNVIYARVSSTSQKTSLDNQIELIKSYMLSKGIQPDEIYSEIASGLNDNRKELNRLLFNIQNNEIKTVYISFKDRLTRFGFNYFKEIFKNNNTEIVILDSNEETNKDFQQELAEDLISVIHQYSTKLYSNRRKKIKEIEKIIQEN